jgi:hypothetical protein
MTKSDTQSEAKTAEIQFTVDREGNPAYFAATMTGKSVPRHCAAQCYYVGWRNQQASHCANSVGPICSTQPIRRLKKNNEGLNVFACEAGQHGIPSGSN